MLPAGEYEADAGMSDGVYSDVESIEGNDESFVQGTKYNNRNYNQLYVPVSPITLSGSVHSMFTDPESSIDFTASLNQHVGNTVEDSLDNMWSIVDMVCEEISLLQARDETKQQAERHLTEHALRLQTLSKMHKESIVYEKVQQMTQLGLLMEMKLYLEMLRDIEHVGKNAGWDSHPFLQETKQIIYRENDKFKLVKHTKS